MNPKEMNNPISPPRPLSPPRESPQRLTFSPLAWLKLQWFLHAGETEVGGFGVSAEHDPLYVQDFVTVMQRTTAVTVAFDDDAVADLFDALVDAGLPPARFARLWIHTHPGDSPHPSSTDEQTFGRAFGGCDWAVMFILSRTGRTYARLRFSAGPGADLHLPVDVDWGAWPQALADADGGGGAWALQWKAEFDRNVKPRPLMPRRPRGLATKPERPTDIDLLLGQGWPWDDIEASDLGELQEQQVLEADLLCLLESTLDEDDRTEGIQA
jgi:proteasome lid subunit RPN8/RPN11